MPEPRYLLDTNILSAAIRQPAGPVGQRLIALPPGAACTSIIVACELRYGARKKGSPALTERVDAVLSSIEVEPLASGADHRYAELRTALEARGQPIGGNDLLIAAHALELDCVLVTANTGEFRRVEGLRVEDWTSPEA
jgi:tRNA(fMet)-specific endonuclease VapC